MGGTFESIDMLITRKFIARNARRYAVHWTAVILKDWKAYHMMSLYESMNQKDYNIIPECVWMDVYGCVRMCKSKKITYTCVNQKIHLHRCVKMCKHLFCILCFFEKYDMLNQNWTWTWNKYNHPFWTFPLPLKHHSVTKHVQLLCVSSCSPKNV